MLIPVLAWTTIVTIIDLVLFCATKGNLGTAITLKEYARKVLFELWFIWSVFWGCIGMITFRRIKNRILRATMICIAVMGLFVFPDKWNLYLYKYTIPFFGVGYLWNKYSLFKKFSIAIKKHSRYMLFFIVAGLVIVYCVMLAFYNRDSFIYLSKVSIIGKDSTGVWHQLKIDLYRWIIGIIGCALAGVFCMAINKLPTQALAYIGKKSMGIYIISGYLNSRVLLKCTAEIKPNYFVNGIETVLMLFICLAIITILEKNKLINSIFLGSR